MEGPPGNRRPLGVWGGRGSETFRAIGRLELPRSFQGAASGRKSRFPRRTAIFDPQKPWGPFFFDPFDPRCRTAPRGYRFHSSVTFAGGGVGQPRGGAPPEAGRI